jgi:hypothetical protein
MLLNEFFGKSLDLDKHKQNLENKSVNPDELFWYILDHDRMHKDYVMPLARKIKKAHNEGSSDRAQHISEFMPMVERGCKEFYNHKELTGKLGNLFPKKFREEMCERLCDHLYDDIIKDCYSIGM